MSKSYDVIVVGVGGVGSAVCYQLAKRGVKVLGLERFAIPHAQGGTHGYSRQTKIAAYIGGVYEPLVRRSYELYRELIEEVRQPGIMVETGFVDILAGQRSGAYKHDGGAFEYLDHAELQHRFPQFQLPETYWGALDPAGALLHPELAITSHVRQALALGAEIRGQTRVLDWEADGAGVRVKTDRETYVAERMVLCAGPWMGTLLGDLGITLTANRMSFAWVWPSRNVSAYELGNMPCWCIGSPGEGTYYGFPMMGNVPGFKIGLHWYGETVDPDDFDRAPNAQDEERIRNGLRKYLPDADGPLLGIRTCLYDHTPDDVPIVDVHPQHDRVILCGPLCGAGFKFIPAYAEAAADLAEDKAPGFSIDFLQINRLLANHPTEVT